MNSVDLPIIGFQIALPLVLLIWLATAPLRSAVGFAVQAAAVGVGLVALALGSIWIVPPWWTPYVYGLFWALIVARRLLRARRGFDSVLPTSLAGWAVSGAFFLFGLAAVSVVAGAVAGRAAPAEDIVDLPFPMGEGVYLVAHGGSRETVNGHYLTLRPTTGRQRAYRGQSYAVDLVKIDAFGRRAPGWRPADPAAYLIFAEPVYAPCSGEVLSAEGNMPDMAPPQPDLSSLEGNHVFIDCGGVGVLLAHFRQGSVESSVGDVVERGQKIGEVGNTGKTFEPHLHIHAQKLVDQKLADNGPVFSGDPLHLRLDGRFPVRNDRIIKR